MSAYLGNNKCGHCAHFGTCGKLVKFETDYCQWHPNRFELKSSLIKFGSLIYCEHVDLQEITKQKGNPVIPRRPNTVKEK